MKKSGDTEYWIKAFAPGNISRNVDANPYNPSNKDFSVVVLADGGCTEGLVTIPTKGWSTEGLYDGGGLMTLTSLYELLRDQR